ncbi:MAG: spore coat associated protein CotJA [Syntrophomonadaceae bacterium]|nr:spore coat associated protein CotJA [Syntrophomonadaceae bacterium]
MDKISHPDKKLARAYVPFQVYSTRWGPLEGLKRGTIFPELYRPYIKQRNKYQDKRHHKHEQLPEEYLPEHPKQKWGRE